MVESRKEGVAEEGEERGFEGLKYIAPEAGKSGAEYFVIKKSSCSKDQWQYLMNNLPLHPMQAQGVLDTLQICNDVGGWFDNDEDSISNDDTIVTFNDLFIYEEK